MFFRNIFCPLSVHDGNKPLFKNTKEPFSKIMLHVPEADKGVPYNHHLIKIASVKFLRITVEILYAWPVILKLIIKKLFTKQMLM